MITRIIILIFLILCFSRLHDIKDELIELNKIVKEIHMVEIIHYETANKNKAIGYVDVRVPITKPTVMIFRKIAHIQSGEKRWFNLPTFSRELGGKTSYMKHAQFETEAYNAKLLEALTEKVKEYCKQHGIQIDNQQINLDLFPEFEEVPF